MSFFTLHVAGVTRHLPVIQISDTLSIASFVILGDAELVVHAAAELKKKLPEADYLLTAEAKGIPLAQELSRIMGMKRYFVARKSIKPYMAEPFVTEVRSMTTQKKQILCLDRAEAGLIRDRRILIIDDVISTGESIQALELLVREAGGQVAGKAAILAEGQAAERSDIIYLEKLPVFPVAD
ncbi:phosphoribosyltransferase family protein [Sporolactobacillus sp. Y61]|uniref:Phosphoribosyltransferase family protein n=1 Tax=Sporolactobacillus sp. Y61 TaxID=3160863 RepID=A0AAU8IIJ5_9BACL